MIRTNTYSRFTLKTLEEIRDSADIILQIEKTDSTFTESKKAVYLCEVVNATYYNRRDTAECLAEELVRVNKENTRLLRRADRLSSTLQATEKALHDARAEGARA